MELETSTNGNVTPSGTGEPVAGATIPHDSRKNIILAGGALIALGLVVGVVLYTGILSFLFLSKDVRNLSYIDEQGVLQTPGTWSFTEDTTYNSLGDVLAVQKDASVDVAVVRSSEGIVDVALYPHEGSPSLLTSNAEREDAPAISSDGSHVAYSVFRSTVKNVVSSSNITEWHVLVWSKETGDTVDLGVGYGPAFVDDDTVLMTTLDGVVLYKISSKSFTTVQLTVDGMIGGTAKVSDDGRYVTVYDASAAMYRVYTLTDGMLTPVASVDATGIVSLTSRDNVLYVLIKKGNRTYVRKGVFGESMKLSQAFVLPSAPVITAIY